MPVTTYLFVYGTLRPPIPASSTVYSFNYPKIVPFLRSSTDAWVDGAEMYDLGSFPATIPGTGRVVGVLFEIDPAAFEILDPLEGHPDLYYREIVPVGTAGGRFEAWIYWAPEDLAHDGVRVLSGDWLRSKPGATDSPGL